jgi:hypothetical protein
MAPPGPGRWTTGVVIDYDPTTQNYRLSIEGVGYNETAPRLARDPGDLTILPPDTIVVVHDALGYWVIDAVLKQAPITPSNLPPPTISEVRGVGGEDPARADIGEDGARPANRAPTDSVDTLAGDWIRRSPDGNFLGALAGGVNVMQSAPFAAIRTHALEELVEIFAHQYRHISAMGNFEIKTDNGKTSLVWRAGADQGDENGPGQENWTIRLDVGATGDLFDLSITTPDGNLLSRIHMSSSGKLQLIGVDGVDIVSGGDPKVVGKEVTASSKDVEIKGSLTQAIGQDMATQVGGSREASISGNDSVMFGNDKSEVVSRDYNSTINGHWRQKVVGGMVPAPGVPAYELELMNGGVTFVMSDVLTGANPAGMASFNVINNFGGVNFVCAPTAAGGFNVITALPGSVNLGATGTAIKLPNGSWQIGAVAPFGVMMYEPFMAMMTALLVLLDSHVHITAVGPTTPIPIFTAAVSPLLPLIRSLRVSVGM